MTTSHRFTFQKGASSSINEIKLGKPIRRYRALAKVPVIR